jgi:hypothetical protein
MMVGSSLKGLVCGVLLGWERMKNTVYIIQNVSRLVYRLLGGFMDKSRAKTGHLFRFEQAVMDAPGKSKEKGTTEL